MPDEPNSLCKAHSGIKARVGALEDNVKALWENWNSMQKIVLAIFITLSINLLGVVFLLLRTYMK